MVVSPSWQGGCLSFPEERGSPLPRPWEKGQLSSTKQASAIYFQPPAGSEKARDSQALVCVCIGVCVRARMGFRGLGIPGFKTS